MCSSNVRISFSEERRDLGKKRDVSDTLYMAEIFYIKVHVNIIEDAVGVSLELVNSSLNKVYTVIPRGTRFFSGL